MALSEQIESASRIERRRGPQEITDIHLTHNPRGRLDQEAAERRKAARAVARLAAQFGMGDAVGELLDALGLTRDTTPAAPARPRPARWRDAKECTLCRVVKPLDQFWRDRNHTDGHASRCKACGRRARNANKEST